MERHLVLLVLVLVLALALLLLLLLLLLLESLPPFGVAQHFECLVHSTLI